MASEGIPYRRLILFLVEFDLRVRRELRHRLHSEWIGDHLHHYHPFGWRDQFDRDEMLSVLLLQILNLHRVSASGFHARKHRHHVVLGEIHFRHGNILVAVVSLP